MYSAISVIATLGSISGIFLNTGLYFREHLRKLQDDIKELSPQNFNQNEFKQLIVKHKNACEYFKRMTKVFGPIIVTKLLLIAMFLCTLGFQLTEVGNEHN